MIEPLWTNRRGSVIRAFLLSALKLRRKKQKQLFYLFYKRFKICNVISFHHVLPHTYVVMHVVHNSQHWHWKYIVSLPKLQKAIHLFLLFVFTNGNFVKRPKASRPFTSWRGHFRRSERKKSCAPSTSPIYLTISA